MHALMFLLMFSTAVAWGPIRPVIKTVHVADASTARFVLPIRSSGGQIIYILACYGPKSQPGTNDFVYDGDFESRLTEEGKKLSAYSTLLTEDPNQSRDWESRARFFGSELEGQCGEIPEFGRKRDFLLRGMRISLQISGPVFSSNQKLESFTFTVSVQNDSEPLAQGQIASTAAISRRWKDLPCKLDNSVTPHFSQKK